MQRCIRPIGWAFGLSFLLFYLLLPAAGMASAGLSPATHFASGTNHADGDASATDGQPAPIQIWTDGCVDCPTWFSQFTVQRGLQLDGQGRPRVVYGGAHLYYAVRNGDAWDTTIVDSAPGVGAYASLGLGRNDTPHILYCDTLHNKLKYATWAGDRWSVSVIMPSSLACLGSLAVDGNGQPHIAFSVPVGEQRFDLYYGRQVGGVWHFERVDQFEDAISIEGITAVSPISLALDDHNRPRIAYRDYGAHAIGLLKVAQRTDGGWVREVVELHSESSYAFVVGISLAVDASGGSHIAYLGVIWGHPGRSDLRYAHQKDNGWQITTVEPYFQAIPALVVDKEDLPHIGYSMDGQQLILHADGSGWKKQVVAASNIASGPTSLVLDRDGRFHLTYDYPELTYAAQTGDGWLYSQIARATTAGRGNALGLDAAGNPHIAYVDYDIYSNSGPGTLEYARRVGDVWVIQPVYTYTATTYILDLALDHAGNPHITFVDGSSDSYELKYASWTGMAWQIQTVDTIPYPIHVSLALDDGDHAHISYGSYTLKYAHEEDDHWLIQTVDIPPSMQGIRTSSIKLDANQIPSISYFSQWELRYARLMGSTWVTQTIASTSGELSRTDLALDTSGMPHIAYCGSLDSLHYVRWTGSAWDNQIVVPIQELQGCGDSSLALDADNHPYLSYVLYSHPTAPVQYADLTYAEWTGSQWASTLVKSIGTTFLAEYYGTSFALDAGDLARISSYDFTTGGLYYSRALDCSHLACQYQFLPLSFGDKYGFKSSRQ